MSMFSSSTKDKAAPALPTPANGNDKDGSSMTTVIAKGTVIEGKFACNENVRLDGAIHGEVVVDKRFVMGDTSYVQGNINVRDAAIKGKIKGDLIVKEALHLMDTAVIEGNITARTMIVEEGARYNGACKIGGNGSPNSAATANVVSLKN
jgi:cytoskeletal protein CcmA (bactofilin family)